MKLLKFLLGVSRTTVAFAILAGVVAGIGSAALLALVGVALNGDDASATRLVWSFAGLCLVMPAARFVSDFLLVRLGQEGILELRRKLSRQVLASPLRRMEEIGAHRLLATLTDDVQSITNALTLIPTLCINVAVVIGCLGYLCWLSPLAFLVVISFLGLGIFSYQVPLLYGMRLHRLAREGADALYRSFRALTEGTKELKLNRPRRAAFLTDVLDAAARSLRRHNVAAMTSFSVATSWVNVLFFISIGTILFVGPRPAAFGAAARIPCVLTILYMVTPLDLIMNALASLSRASVALQKVETLGLSLGVPHSGQTPTEVAGAARAPRLLELSGVTHSYHREQENRNFTLGPIDLAFIPGEMVFIIGGNGSGKTTLIKLLTGLYTPETGDVILDGQPVTEETREEYLQQFAAVFSDFYLFESLLGLDGRGLDEKAIAYLKQLHLEHKVQITDGALSTTALSQGQRKRLALLVAYLEDRPFYVFDEWAADQDPEFKEIFYYQLLPELKARGKTVIVISHDDRYYDVADRVVKLENGRVVEGRPSRGGVQVVYSEREPAIAK
ncbi:MAG: cyclic peptide export ABC transporter [Acidobacteria bacterium]|nr:cyclic peptide export ABC transporter [Acidobacteriota bacterium]